MRRIIVLLLVLTFLLSSLTVFAESNHLPQPEESVEEAIKRANEELGYDYYDLSKVNKEVYEKYGVLVYGSPSGDKDSNGEYRYLGTMPDGTEYTNYNRMHDDWAGGVLDTRNWIKDPWNDPNISGASKSPFNNNPEWNDAMIAGLKYAYGDGITSGAIGDWTKYVQILQPPTDGTWGMGRMWHVTSAGKIWYITFPITPLEFDINTPENFVPKPPQLPPPKVTQAPRSPQVAIKWDTVPLKISQSSTITGKIRRDTSFTWVEYLFEVEQVFNGASKGKKTIKTVTFSQDKFFQPRTTAKDWYTEEPKPSFSVPSNGKPGTVLIARLKAKIRYNETFPSLPPAPQKPQPEVYKPNYSKPSKPWRPWAPDKPDKDAPDEEWDAYWEEYEIYEEEYDVYLEELDVYNELIGPWDEYEAYISTPEYKQYLLEKEDYDQLVSVRGRYNILEDKDPELIPVEGYNFGEYAAYHSAFNSFVSSHYKRHVKIEDYPIALYWFTRSHVEAQAESKNTIVDNTTAPTPGGMDPGIIVKPKP